MRKSAVATSMILLATCAGAVEPEEGPVFIADAQFQLEDVLQEVLVTNRPNHLIRFWVVVTGDQVALMTKSHGITDRKLVKGVDLMRQFGAFLRVCESDLSRLGLVTGDLLPWVEPVRGFDAAAPKAADDRFYADERPDEFPASVEALRRIRTACSAAT